MKRKNEYVAVKLHCVLFCVSEILLETSVGVESNNYVPDENFLLNVHDAYISLYDWSKRRELLSPIHRAPRMRSAQLCFDSKDVCSQIKPIQIHEFGRLEAHIFSWLDWDWTENCVAPSAWLWDLFHVISTARVALENASVPLHFDRQRCLLRLLHATTNVGLLTTLQTSINSLFKTPDGDKLLVKFRSNARGRLRAKIACTWKLPAHTRERCSAVLLTPLFIQHYNLWSRHWNLPTLNWKTPPSQISRQHKHASRPRSHNLTQ